MPTLWIKRNEQINEKMGFWNFFLFFKNKVVKMHLFISNQQIVHRWRRECFGEEAWAAAIERSKFPFPCPLWC